MTQEKARKQKTATYLEKSAGCKFESRPVHHLSKRTYERIAVNVTKTNVAETVAGEIHFRCLGWIVVACSLVVFRSQFAHIWPVKPKIAATVENRQRPTAMHPSTPTFLIDPANTNLQSLR
jgi:hypothetical protein